jgi:hypothetical protein
VGWALIGARLHPLPDLRSILIFLGPFCVPLAPWIVIALTVFSLFFFFGAQWLLDPQHFLLALPIIAIVWFFYHRSSSRFKKTIAKTLQPWLLGMAIVGAAYLAVSAWLPQTQWPWIFRIETAASWCEVALNKILPESIFFNLALLLLILSINLLQPTWKTWTGRFEKVISKTHSIASVLAVVTSFTFFGAGQAAVLVKATAQEKADRLKDESTALGELILAARVSEDRKVEAQATRDFLDAVHAGVVVDLQLPPDLSERNLRTSQAERLRTLVTSRVSELLKYISEAPLITDHMSHVFDRARLEGMLGRKFSDEEIRDAKTRFESALDEFVREGAGLSFHPLQNMLEAGGLPDLAQSIVKDLYKSELYRLAKDISSPLADSLFRAGSVPADSTVAKLAAIVKRPAFESRSLPAEVRTPTLERRLSERVERTSVRNSVERAGRVIK